MKLYSIRNNAKDNTTGYLVRFLNLQKANEACNGSLISRGFQEHGMDIIFPLHVTGFDTLLGGNNKEDETAG